MAILYDSLVMGLNQTNLQGGAKCVIAFTDGKNNNSASTSNDVINLSKKTILFFMDSFVVSARKYRPSTFKSVVGQDALTTTLRNAIKSKKLAHAYLFCGPRGVGKTTCARIFAKTIGT